MMSVHLVTDLQEGFSVSSRVAPCGVAGGQETVSVVVVMT